MDQPAIKTRAPVLPPVYVRKNASTATALALGLHEICLSNKSMPVFTSFSQISSISLELICCSLE